MRRKSGVLLPIEVSILEAALDLRRRGTDEFHGFLIATEIAETEGSRLLTAYGTLYKALSRMEKAGLLQSQWEDPMIAASVQRPRRRLYRLTAAGELALARSAADQPGSSQTFREGLAPS